MSTDSQARLFAAVELPEEVRLRVSGWARQVAAATVALMRSWLEPRGARYEVQASVRLGPLGA